MNGHLDKEAIIVNELGAPSGLMDLSDEGRLYIGSMGGGLGWSLGASIGAQLAEPDRQVACNIGYGPKPDMGSQYLLLLRITGITRQ